MYETLRRRRKSGGRDVWMYGGEGCGPRGLVGMLLRICCPWVLVYMNLGRVLLGLAMLHVVGGVEEEDRAW